MRTDDYQKEVNRTLKCDMAKQQKVSMLSMGLAGEAGEVIDLLKKHIFHNHTLDRDNLKKELGDTLWYLTGIATEYQFTLNEIMETNIEKLQKRYPNGFSCEKSINRHP